MVLPTEQEQLISSLVAALRTLQPTTTSLDPFSEGSETMANFFVRLENFFALRQIPADPEGATTSVRVQNLINYIGAKYVSTVYNVCAPVIPEKKKYSDVKQLLINHFDKPVNEVVEQHRFMLRVQSDTESVNQFVTELKRQAALCNFTCGHCTKPTSELHLRAQFIRGIRDSDTRRELLQKGGSESTTTFTFDKAVEYAVAAESSKLGNDVIQNSHFNASTSGPKPVNKLQVNKNKSTRPFSQLRGSCFRCGDKDHRADKCPHSKEVCSFCNKVGHITKVCQLKLRRNKSNSGRGGHSGRGGRSKRPYYRQNIPNTGATNPTNPNEVNYFDFHVLNLQCNSNSNNSDKILLNFDIGNKNKQLELDTGAAVTTLRVSVIRELIPGIKILPTTDKLRSFDGTIIDPIGVVNLFVKYKSNAENLTAYIVPNSHPEVVGRTWIKAFRILPPELLEINTVSTEVNYTDEIKKLIREYSDLFSGGYGKIPNFQCSLCLKDNAVPVFMKPRTLPYAIKPLVEAEIEKLLAQGILSPAKHPTWGTPIVPVINSKGALRICGDYKVTINKYLIAEKYPIPNVEEMFSKLAGGTHFVSLDIFRAYFCMVVDELSAILQCLSTHLGAFYVHRLMFGVGNAPWYFQKFMDEILSHILGAAAFYDDVKVQGATAKELLDRLRMVFQTFREHGLKLNKDKCQFNLKSITYLGFVIDANGIRKTPEKIETIVKCDYPKNIEQLRSFIGLINYYGRFIPNMADILAPMYQLMQKDVQFVWNNQCQAAFVRLKQEMTEDRILVPYDPKLPLVLAADASSYGLGACLSHILPGNEEKPIAFCSRTLSKAERGYSQLHKEATAIYWAVKKFFVYLFGRKFILHTDHKPLTAIFHPNKNLPDLTAARLLRYACFLSNFDYDIQYRRSEKHSNADFPSRFPLPIPSNEKTDAASSVLLLEQISILPVTRAEIVSETAKDPALIPVLNGLRSNSGLEKTCFAGQEAEFSIESDCIFRGCRVVVPKALQQRVLQELHTAHIGSTKMKNLARNYVYWSGIDRDIENITTQCSGCSQVRNNPPKIDRHPWLYPEISWYRLHLDYAGPFLSNYFLLVVDAYSKWVEIFVMSSITTSKTISFLQDLYTRFGLPVMIVTNNGPQWTSEEFKMFNSSNGIIHKFAAPYHPASNGQVERYVQVLKNSLKASLFDSSQSSSITERVNLLLIQLRRTTHSLTGKTPAELLLRHSYRTKLDLLIDPHTKRIRSDQIQQIENTKLRDIKPGDPVNYRVYNDTKRKWATGLVISKGPLNAVIRGENGETHRRHLDQMVSAPHAEPSSAGEGTSDQQHATTSTSSEQQPPTSQNQPDPPKPPSTDTELRRSSRSRKIPSRLDI
ncbi:uncharacterized protein K02A2.6-like [Planococcus citri]|uniref:uncharacterized protein K02A2.6-like n=1 Tax=Planococcus citri TaxID=170843 RepID=UPI0031F7B35E